jgi:hypothetical protein
MTSVAATLTALQQRIYELAREVARERGDDLTQPMVRSG